MQRIIAILVVLSTVILGAGCKSVAYNPAYTRAVAMSIVPRYHATVLIYTTPSDDKLTFGGRPKSLTGVAWKLKAPLGEMCKKIAGDIYGHTFDGGYELSNTVSNQAHQFDLILHPSIEDFAWRMNQAKNLGFAITPQVKMTLDIQLLSPTNGAIIFQRQYESGWVDGNAYMVSVTPFDSVNAVIHTTMADLMVDSFRDLDTVLRPDLIQDRMPQSPPLTRQSGYPNSRQHPQANSVGIPAMQTYAGAGSGHWIDDVFDDGNLIKLEDGSLWKVAPLDTIDSSLWLPTTEVTVIDGDDPEFPYKLINTEDDEVVSAALIKD